MLPIVLVLLVATSTLAAPSVILSINSIDEAIPPKPNGRPVSAYWTDQASEIVDGGDTNAYTLTAQEIINDLANRADPSSQALALAELIGLLGELGTGIPGDACATADAIDQYVDAVRSGNSAEAREAVSKIIQILSSSIDLIVKLATNPKPLRYVTGPRGNCKDGGRIYSFEAAWDYILRSDITSSPGLVKEQYCAAKRLYNAFNSRSSNVGAILTAASLPPINRIFELAIKPVARFVASISSGNPAATAVAAKRALARAVSN